jgi:hypothetical protein
MVKRLGIALIAVLTFGSEAESAGWLSPDWGCRVTLTADQGSIADGESFSDVTLLVSMDNPAFAPVFTTAGADGSDLVITASDGTTVLDHELVTYDATLQVAELWFKAPVLSDLENQFYLYYGNGLETPEQAAQRVGDSGAAWSAEHLAVYHFAEDPTLGILMDWGPGENHAVADVGPFPVGPGWTSSNLVDGVVGKAWEYDGIDLYTHSSNVVSADSSFTISAWFTNTTLADKGAVAFQGPWESVWELEFQRTGGEAFSGAEASGGFFAWSCATLDPERHHYAWTMDAEADTVRFFLDGVETPFSVRYTGNLGNIGSVYTAEGIFGRVGIAGPVYWNSADLVNGVVDEYRIIEGVRSPGQLLTEYYNMSDPITFFAVGTEELYTETPTATGPWQNGSALGAVSVYPNPFQAMAWIDVEARATGTVANVYDVKGRLVQTLSQPRNGGGGVLRYLWDGRDMGGATVGNGIYYVRVRNGASAVTSKLVLVR